MRDRAMAVAPQRAQRARRHALELGMRCSAGRRRASSRPPLEQRARRACASSSSIAYEVVVERMPARRGDREQRVRAGSAAGSCSPGGPAWRRGSSAASAARSRVGGRVRVAELARERVCWSNTQPVLAPPGEIVQARAQVPMKRSCATGSARFRGVMRPRGRAPPRAAEPAARAIQSTTSADRAARRGSP